MENEVEVIGNQVKLSVGIAYLRERFTRKMRKNVVKKMFSGVQIDSKGGASGLNLESKIMADDYVVREMVEKIVMNDGTIYQYPVSEEIFDELPSPDFDKILAGVEQMTSNSGVPKE
jgi:hypothetical protein